MKPRFWALSLFTLILGSAANAEVNIPGVAISKFSPLMTSIPSYRFQPTLIKVEMPYTFMEFGESQTITATLSEAPTTITKVLVTSNALSVPAQVLFNPGETVKTFQVSHTLHHGLDGSQQLRVRLGTAIFDFQPFLYEHASVSSVDGEGRADDPLFLRVQLPVPAGVNGVYANVITDPSLNFPAQVFIPPGKYSALLFDLPSHPVNKFIWVPISAGRAGDEPAKGLLRLASTYVEGITIDRPTTMPGGTSFTATCGLNGHAAPGQPVLVRDDSPAVNVPATINLAGGVNQFSFVVDTQGVAVQTTVKINVFINALFKTLTITLKPATPKAFTMPTNTVTGGQSTTGTITINGKAPAGGLYYNVSSDGPEAIVPAKVGIPQGKSEATFTIRTKPVTVRAIRKIAVEGFGTSKTLVINKP